MRTTLDLDDQVLAAARERARQQGRTLTSFVEEALAAAVAIRPRKVARFRLAARTVRGRYIAGVDLADRDALYDVMDGRR